MASIQVIYGTKEGQTEKIATYIGNRLRAAGHEVTLSNVASLPRNTSFTGVDGVLVGSSVHYGRHSRAMRRFVASNRETLLGLPTGFFQVCLASSRTDPESRAEAQSYLDEFVAGTGWQPDRITSFAGALAYTRYGFLKRLMMKRIARETTGDVDTARDYEYTDWNAVDEFATDFATLVESNLADAPST
ncbi:MULTISPECIES: menaquinone-dependent protoporphyrinogen IX dehydrogenase [unclassified Haladaptatus]|uniref:menaquinone-dependent protoporphyrinogen IX dehydrogenase n=1 Tax=unclassified Haladaptatus TaxID=2622732 RepID=UPI0023E7ED10|nr:MULTISPECIES: menaquinone-dependent protoporphyrinogen IX dehydrogenase [unclassified Haladaptatus]